MSSPSSTLFPYTTLFRSLDLRRWEWRQRAGKQFRELLTGPVIVMSSKKPFLEWEDLRRVGNTRSVAAVTAERKSPRLNSTHPTKSYALSCSEKKNQKNFP